ncbi:hypothetical protein CCUS01_09566 [Colletotrichum cuscutae]|uniref:Uncharacterized protein n=1 Tax=Colletotrichum cuscutae TaxID=1209917 RepID=A0AAI9XPJ3_9PEZI|nr:hypothetical protein CCUS01_09566 [Colletotrichum cuscutae]
MRWWFAPYILSTLPGHHSCQHGAPSLALSSSRASRSNNLSRDCELAMPPIVGFQHVQVSTPIPEGHYCNYASTLPAAQPPTSLSPRVPDMFCELSTEDSGQMRISIRMDAYISPPSQSDTSVRAALFHAPPTYPLLLSTLPVDSITFEPSSGDAVYTPAQSDSLTCTRGAVPCMVRRTSLTIVASLFVPEQTEVTNNHFILPSMP